MILNEEEEDDVVEQNQAKVKINRKKGANDCILSNEDKSSITTVQMKTATISPANLATFQPELADNEAHNNSVTYVLGRSGPVHGNREV